MRGVPKKGGKVEIPSEKFFRVLFSFKGIMALNTPTTQTQYQQYCSTRVQLGNCKLGHGVLLCSVLP